MSKPIEYATYQDIRRGQAVSKAWDLLDPKGKKENLHTLTEYHYTGSRETYEKLTGIPFNKILS